LTAVNHLTFGVHKEECFGLLGVNGSGKTTTFQMLTGDLMVDNGNAYINSYELRKDLFSYQKQIGYCPQFDALLDKLTGEELLYLFARLRGLPSSVIPLKVKSLIQMTDLQNDAKKCTETYSGGNRRKLSLALAIIGNPSIIFLDEPTSGVDPSARRKIWSTLDYIKKTYRSAIILTSHSMEESEALCGRIAIMVGGQFRCLGPTQHLRSKFCQGFTVIVKLRRELNDDSGYVSRVQQYMNKEFPSAVLRDSHQCLFHYHITDPSVKWSHIFRVMESAKKEYNFEDYSVSDTSLEQIFITFARTQNQILK
jgi:ATP-binding cassette subfamily A (ABC1) protein 3